MSTAPLPPAKRACIVCAKAKRQCSGDRPCDRCIRLGKEHACIDCPSKKKNLPSGKPRGRKPEPERNDRYIAKTRKPGAEDTDNGNESLVAAMVDDVNRAPPNIPNQLTVRSNGFDT